MTEPSDAAVSTPGIRGDWILLLILCAGAFTTALNVTMLSPLVVKIADEFKVSEAAAGQLATLTAASSGVFAVVVAPWMDRYSRSFWLRLECGLLTVGTLLSALAPSFELMFVGRALAGLGGSVIGANCLAACAGLYRHPNDRNRAIGLINTAFTLGAVIGLPVVTLTADWTDWRWAIALPAPLALLVFAATNRLPRITRPRTESLWGAWKSGYGRVWRSRETVLLLAAMIMVMVVWFGWLIFFGAFTENVYGVSASVLSLLFLAGGGAEVVANNLAPLLMRNRTPRAVAYPMILISAINLVMVGFAFDRQWTMFPFIFIGSASGAMLFVCLNIALLDSLPGDSGAVMSLQSACLEIGGSIGVAMTGLGLAIIDDYEVVYRLLGVVSPLIAVALWLSARRPGQSIHPEPAIAAA